MKYKCILGLDIGTNSLGWSLIKEYEDSSIEIMKNGVHIFPIGTIVDQKSNKEKTKNEQRRVYRGASRMRFRFKLRRKNLKSALESLQMYPDYSIYQKAKGKGQSFELYKLRADAINSNLKVPLTEIGRIFLLLNKYRGFKSNAKKLQKSDTETGEVKKGYESLQKLINNSRSETIGEYFFKMHELGKEWYDDNKWHNPNEPIDERAYNEDSGEFILFNSNGIRRHYGRYTLRDMYLHEFDQIWKAQKNHYPEILTGSKKEYEELLLLPYVERIKALKEFRKTNYWLIRDYCIYFQRPLKSQKKYVSNCQFERGEYDVIKNEILEDGIKKIKEKKVWKKKAKKASPKSNPYYQEFKIWQKIHQIHYSSIEEDVFQNPLKQEWLPVLTEYLMTNFELYLNKTPKIEKENKIWIGKILQANELIQNSDNYTFYIDQSDEDIVHEEKNENRINGNLTYATFFEALGEETFNRLKNKISSRKEFKNKDEVVEVKESKLLELWHHLYIAKDGLFNEDDWLKCILTEKSKWNLTSEQADALISKGLVGDYGSYSIKVLKAILPNMRKGLNEYDALKTTNKGYINEDNTIGEKVKLKEKISQLKYQELRNPVVERSLSKTIKLTNAILEKFKDEIDRGTFEIRIESTRQLRKPRQERENERRKNADKDRLREQYAEQFEQKNNELGEQLFSKHIYKNDPIIRTYELWLEMNMNEGDELFGKEFNAFSKITKKEDKLKHKLWLECGRTCPYTGKIINLTDCFSSEVEIEHIIPLSRSLDDSFNNKTLTYSFINKEKGKMTPLEYIERKGGIALSEFKARIKYKTNSFSDSKKKQFLAEKISATFSNNQLVNTSYIAKYTRKKMQEVCKNVQFTNGSATSELRYVDWRLSNLLDKIRYKENFDIEMDEVNNNYFQLKKDFTSWCTKKYNSTDIKIEWRDIKNNKDVPEYFSQTKNDLLYWYSQIEDFNQFRNKDGKKDRNDHRHHAIDAFITACCSPRIIQKLSAYNATREEQHSFYREKIDPTFSYNDLRDNISAILVSHSEKQTLIKKRINKIKAKETTKTQITYAPQGKLHEESFYGKRNSATVRRVELFDDQRQEKNLFESSDNLHYKIRGEIKWNYIEDNELYKITKRRLDESGKKAFTKEQMENTPFFRVSPKTPEIFKSRKKQKPLPIVKSVRKRFNTDRTLINLPAKDSEGIIINQNRYAENESNYIIVFYKNGLKKFAKPLTFFSSVQNKRNGKPLLADEVEYKGITYGIDQNLPWLKNGDIVLLSDKANDVDFNDNIYVKEHLFKVKGISSLITPNEKYGNYEYGRISLLKINISKADNYPNKKDIKEAIKTNAFTISHDKFNAVKVRLNILGNIIATGKDCF